MKKILRTKEKKPKKQKLPKQKKPFQLSIQFQSIRSIVVTALVLFTSIVFFLQIGYSFQSFRNLIQQEIDRNLESNAKEEAANIEADFAKWGQANSFYASTVASIPDFSTDLALSLGILKNYMATENLIVGGGFWLEPFQLSQTQKYYGPFIYRSTNGLILTWPYKDKTNEYFQHDWYQNAINGNSLVTWSEPYSDDVTKVPVITASSPIIKNGKNIGVTTIDIGLSQLQEYVSSIKVGKKGFAYLLTKQGAYLAHPDSNKVLNAKITEEADANLRKLGTEIMNSSDILVHQSTYKKVSYFVVSAPIGDTGLKLILNLPANEIYSAINQTFIINILIAITSMLLLLFVLSMLINRVILNPLKLIKEDAKHMAEGNLGVHTNLLKYSEKKHEIGTLAATFIHLSENTKNLILEMKESIDQIDTSCKELGATAHQVETTSEQVSLSLGEIAHGTSEQAISAQSGNEVLKGIMSALSELSDYAKNSEALTEESVHSTAQSSKNISYQKEKMMESKQATRKVADAIKILADNSKQIETIMNTIENIANETNLLSLNAAIEAARAGEHGRGFAVVAGEVKKLSEQSTDSTHKIHSLVADIHQNISVVLQEMNHTEAMIKEQEDSLNLSVASFDTMFSSNEKINHFIEAVISEVHRLEVQAEEVIEKIGNLANITEESAASTEEISASTEQNVAAIQNVEQEIKNLSNVVSKLKMQGEKFQL